MKDNFSYRDPGQRSIVALVAKYWDQALRQGVKNPEVWVARMAGEEYKASREKQECASPSK